MKAAACRVLEVPGCAGSQGREEEDAWRKGAGGRPGDGAGTGQASSKGVRPRGGSRQGQGIRSRETHQQPCSQQLDLEETDWNLLSCGWG